MKLLEFPFNGQTYSYQVGKNGVKTITKKATKFTIIHDVEGIGKVTTIVDARDLPVVATA